MNKLSSAIIKGRLPLERTMSISFPVVKTLKCPEPEPEVKCPAYPVVERPEAIFPVVAVVPPGPPFCKYGQCKHSPFCQDKLGMCFGNWDGGWRE